MNNLERRIEGLAMGSFEQRLMQLEQQMGTQPRPRLIYITPNLEEDESEETPYSVKISSELWAEAFGGPFTKEEIDKLREEYAEERRSLRR
jgi:hypothetical protein